MLPEKLVIQAFGPYVEKQEIDFSDISSHHLFLIQGETGSGKTMLLDAITFALFGKAVVDKGKVWKRCALALQVMIYIHLWNLYFL